jgi:hypothetical protein
VRKNLPPLAVTFWLLVFIFVTTSDDQVVPFVETEIVPGGGEPGVS